MHCKYYLAFLAIFLSFFSVNLASILKGMEQWLLKTKSRKVLSFISVKVGFDLKLSRGLSLMKMDDGKTCCNEVFRNITFDKK